MTYNPTVVFKATHNTKREVGTQAVSDKTGSHFDKLQFNEFYCLLRCTGLPVDPSHTPIRSGAASYGVNGPPLNWSVKLSVAGSLVVMTLFKSQREFGASWQQSVC